MKTKPIQILGRHSIRAMRVVSLLALAFTFSVSAQTTATGQQILALVGIDEENIQQVIAVEQAPKIVMIGVDIVAPIVTDPRQYYFLVHNSATGAWSRHEVAASVWKASIETYLQSVGLPVVVEEAGSAELFTASEQASQIIDGSGFNSFQAALLVLYGSEDNAPLQAADIGYRYDALGRLVKVIDPKNPDRNYEYDKAGNRKTVADD